jgi:hypothetical protein
MGLSIIFFFRDRHYIVHCSIWIMFNMRRHHTHPLCLKKTRFSLVFFLRNWIYISHINLNVYILALIKTPLKEKKNYNLVLAISCQSFLPPAVGATTRHSRHTKRWREDTQHLQLEANLQPDEETSQNSLPPRAAH